LTRALLELQGAVDTEHDLDKCEEALVILSEASLRFAALRHRLVTPHSLVAGWEVEGHGAEGGLPFFPRVRSVGSKWAGGGWMSVEEAAEEEEDANALQKDGVGGGEGCLAESAAVGFGEKRGFGKGVAWEVDVGEGSHHRKWIDGAGHYNNRGQVAHIHTYTHTHTNTHTRAEH